LTVRRVPLAEIRQGVVQVEFSPPSARELELINGPTGEGRTDEVGGPTGETEAGA